MLHCMITCVYIHSCWIPSLTSIAIPAGKKTEKKGIHPNHIRVYSHHTQMQHTHSNDRYSAREHHPAHLTVVPLLTWCDHTICLRFQPPIGPHRDGVKRKPVINSAAYPPTNCHEGQGS
mmetsp:Transcript_47182/g.121958  ORF Transcript_47182/g.121958 Transcript_47182/m.121958 type:complete len:119 (-) Transcript_47182:1570-1926(-)